MYSLCKCLIYLAVDMNFSSLLSALLLSFRLARMSKLNLKEDKMLEVRFVGDDDVLHHILDREEGIRCSYNLCNGYGFFLKTLFLGKGEGREKKEGNVDWLPLIHAPIGDQTRNPGMCPDQESNW